MIVVMAINNDLLKQQSIIKKTSLAQARAIKKVPFVELYAGRLQGVVSSGSDIERVYVSYIEAGTTNFYCSTNNNRVCGGLRGSPCKHLNLLLSEGLLQFGAKRIINTLGMNLDPNEITSAYEISNAIAGGPHKVDASMVFSRFLSYLSYVNLPSNNQPVPEMAWFVK